MRSVRRPARIDFALRGPRTKRIASPMFDFPEPFGPVTAVYPGRNGMRVFRLNDLKFSISTCFRCMSAHPAIVDTGSLRTWVPSLAWRSDVCQTSVGSRTRYIKLPGRDPGLILWGRVGSRCWGQVPAGDLRGGEVPPPGWTPSRLAPRLQGGHRLRQRRVQPQLGVDEGVHGAHQLEGPRVLPADFAQRLQVEPPEEDLLRVEPVHGEGVALVRHDRLLRPQLQDAIVDEADEEEAAEEDEEKVQ